MPLGSCAVGTVQGLQKMWLSDVAGSTTDLRTLQRNNRESVQSDVERIRQEIASGKRHKVGSPEWMKDAGLVYNVKEERVDRIEDLKPEYEYGSEPRFDFSRTGTDVMETEFPPVQWLVEGLLPEGCGILAGPPKLGKSFLTLDLAIAVASGGVALESYPTNQREVLHLDLENGERQLQYRTKNAGRVLPERYHPLDSLPLPEDGFAACKQFLHQYEDGLVIIDTLAKVKGGATKKVQQYDIDYGEVAKYQDLAKKYPGSCILFVHHTRKSSEGDQVESISGTHGLAGATDFNMVMSGKRNSGTARVYVGGRMAEEQEIGLMKIPDGAGFWAASDEALIEDHTQSLTGRNAEAMTVLKGLPDGATVKEMAEKLGCEEPNARTSLWRLEKKGLIRKTSGGRYIINA